MKLLKQTVIFTSLSILTLGLLGACGKQSSKEETSTTQSERVLTDALDHEVKVPNEPKKLIASYLEDYVVALGHTPVAQWTVGAGSIQKYLQSELKDIPTINYDLPYEEVLSFEPDLMLVSSSDLVEGDKYQEYSKIVPTYVVKNSETDTWQDKLKDVANVLDETEKANELIAEYKASAAKLKKELQEKVGESSIAVLWVTNNSAFMVSKDRASGPLLYDDLGFSVPGLVEEISQAATADWSAVSNEKLAQLDADYILLVNSDKEAQMFNEAVWQNIPAVKNNQVIAFDDTTSWQYSGPIAYEKMLEDVRAKILK